MDHDSSFERTARTVVAVVLFALPAYSILIFILALQQLEIPLWMKGEPGFWVAALESIALISSVFLCWRLPDARKYYAVFMDLLLVLVTIAGLQVQFVNLQGAAVANQLVEVRATPEYRRLETRLEEARESLRLLTARLAIIPADQMTQASNNSREIRLVKAEIAGLDDQMNRLEKSALSTKPSTHYGLVDLLTAPDSWWLQTLLVVAFGIGNNVNGILLIHRPQDRVPRSARRLSGVKVRKLLTAPLSPEGERYLETARQLGDNGKVAGYRAVALALEISTSEARKQMEECQGAGRIQNRVLVEAVESPRSWDQVLGRFLFKN